MLFPKCSANGALATFHGNLSPRYTERVELPGGLPAMFVGPSGHCCI